MNKIKNFIKLNKFFYILYFFIFSFVLKIFSFLIKVDDNSIMFVSYGGKRFDDSPKCIYEYMNKNKKNKYKLHFAFINPNNHKELDESDKVRIDTFKYYYLLLKSKYWISNSSVQRGLNFKDNKHMNVLFMHGLTALKKSQKEFKSSGKQFKMFKPERFDLVFIEGKEEKDLVLENINVDKENIMNFGLPRIDELLKINSDIKKKELIKKKLKININKKVILYAPTYREYNKTIINGIKQNNNLKLEKWKQELSEEYVLLLASHYENNNDKKYNFDNNFVYDVCDYNSFNELLAISDILVTDYSNIVFDNYIINKPAFCFGYDYAEYSNKGRGFYNDLNDIYLNKIIINEDELISKIKNIKYKDYDIFAKKITHKFILNYGDSIKKCINKIFFDQKKRVLHINNNTDFGGQQQVFLNMLEKVNKDKYCFDLVVYDDKGPLKDEIINKGCNIYTVPSITRHPLKHIKELKKILNNKKYDIVHQHASNSGILLNLITCKKAGVKKIILHSHASDGKNRLLHYFLRLFIDHYTDLNVACNNKAGKWMFKKDYVLFYNGIDINKYKYSKRNRSYIRKKHNIGTNSVVLGTVGRLDNNKNQKYMIDIFSEYNKMNNDSYLVIVGDGYNMNFLKEYAKSMNLDKKVILTGNISNTNEYYNIFDIFLLTSFNEGLPVVLVEAQANSLKCMVSDSISRESNITNSILYKSLEDEPVKWAKDISNNVLEREDNTDLIIKSGYSIDNMDDQLDIIYS